MTLSRIVLPTAPAGNVVRAGIIFTDGVGVTDQLGAHKRSYLESIGATIEELAIDGESIDDMSKGRLFEFAEASGLELDVKPSIRVGALRVAVRAALAEKAEVEKEEAASAVSTAFTETLTVRNDGPSNADTSAVDNAANTADVDTADTASEGV